ncbi:hypothetical protein QV65_05695, partial [Rhodococcus erythropolis]
AAQDRLESGDQSTGASLPAGGAVGKPFQVDGQAVRYDDELSLPGHGVTGRRSKCAVRKVELVESGLTGTWFLLGR